MGMPMFDGRAKFGDLNQKPGDMLPIRPPGIKVLNVTVKKKWVKSFFYTHDLIDQYIFF